MSVSNLRHDGLDNPTIRDEYVNEVDRWYTTLNIVNEQKESKGFYVELRSYITTLNAIDSTDDRKHVISENADDDPCVQNIL